MNPNPPAGYRVRVAGHLGEQWTAALGDWSLEHAVDGTTPLTAARADQAQVHGLLAVLRDLNATLVSVEPISAPDARTAFPNDPQPRSEASRSKP